MKPTQNSRYGLDNSGVGTSKSTNLSTSKNTIKGMKSLSKSTGKLTSGVIFIKDYVNEMISHSAEIGEFHIIHRKNQRKYENRIIKKELNFISADNQFNGALLPNSNGTWRFISKIQNRILSVDVRGVLTSYSFDCSDRVSYNLNNFFESDSEIIACELFENVINAECKLILLYSNFNICQIELITLLSKDEKYGDNALSKLFNAKSQYLNLKPYLDIPNESIYTVDHNNKIKLIILPHSVNNNDHDILFNFTQIANRVLIVNISSMCVVSNMMINPETYSNVDEEFMTLMKSFVSLFFEKKWTLSQYNLLKKLIIDINNDKNNFENFKKLSFLLASKDEDENINVYEMKNFAFLNEEEEKIGKVNKIYAEIISPLIVFSITNRSVLDIFQIINKILSFFEKIFNYSISAYRSDISKAEGKFKIFTKLFLQCYQRNIDLYKIFKENDPNNKGYLSQTTIVQIFKNLPIGLTNKDIDDILSVYYLFDENNMYMYEYLFNLEEFAIMNLMSDTDAMSNLNANRFKCGFFTMDKENINNKDSIYNIDNKIHSIQRKASYDFEYEDEFKEDDAISEYHQKNHDFIVQRIINGCIHSEITDIVYVKQLQIMFAITPYDKNISIFKTSTQITNHTMNIEKIGIINIDSSSLISPMFLYYIDERNLLISQKINETSSDLIVIDVFKDIMSHVKDEQYLNIHLREKNIVKGIVSNQEKYGSIIKTFSYLTRNELFVLSTNNEVLIINPKSKQFELSFKIQSTASNIFTEICKKICEYPSEKTGEPPYKIVKRFELKSPLEKMLTFSLGNPNLFPDDKSKFFSSDWVIMLNEDNELFSYCVNQLYISQKAKEVDSPIPKADIENLFKYCYTQMITSFKLYKEQNINNIMSYYSIVNKAHENIITSMSKSIKETILYSKEINLDTNEYNIENIHDLIRTIKELNLSFETKTMIEMFPILVVDEPKYEPSDEYFKTELFPKENKEKDLDGDISLPKRQTKLESDLSTIESYVTPLESGVKKFAKFILDKGMKVNTIFSKIDTNEEDIIDQKQFIEGCKSLGITDRDYISKIELDALFKKMDTNNANCVSNDEFKKFFEKNDIETVIERIKAEKRGRLEDNIVVYNAEKFSSDYDYRYNLMSSAIDKIKEVYDDNNVDIKNVIEKLSLKLTKKDIDNYFVTGFIFKNDFKTMLKNENIIISSDDIDKMFLFFDSKNKNDFIYTKDLKNYLPDEIPKLVSVPSIKMNENEYLKVLMSILKKCIKLCITNLDISIDEFTERFLLAKKVNKNIVIADYVPTKLLIEKLKTKLSLSIFEIKILFGYYIDIFNFGVLFKSDLKSKLDSMMRLIYDSGVFDFSSFDTFDTVNASIYLNATKQTLLSQQRYFNDNMITQTIPIFDVVLLSFIRHCQNKGYTNLLSLFDYIKTFDGDNDGFLNQSELNKLLHEVIPQSQYTLKASQCLINNMSEYITFINEEQRPFISISRFVLFIFYSIKRYQVLHPTINIEDLVYIENKEQLLKQFNTCLTSLNSYNAIGSELESYSEDYLKLIREGIFSGMIILNKLNTTEDIIGFLMSKKHHIHDYVNMYKTISNNILIDNFNRRISGIKTLSEIDTDNKESDIDYAKIDIPKIRINIIDSREMINRKRYECDFIENFDFYHTELNTVVNITKIRKSFLIGEISSDGQNLLNHIESSLKINHYLQKEYFGDDASKPKEDFPFIRNFGVFTKEVIIDKKVEEEFYIINEKIDYNEYISLYGLVKSNGGLLQIPELANTDMAFYILRFWGNTLLSLITKLHKMNICYRYFTLKDFYLSKDGKRIKMKNLYNYSFTDLRGDFFNGPDLGKIFLLLNQIPMSNFEALPYEKLNEVYDDPFLAPDFLLTLPKYHNNKIDTWLFGICLFNLLYGYPPISFYSQLKKWCNESTNLIFERIVPNFPYDIISQHFFFNPFSNVNDIMEDDLYFTKVLSMKSFSAVIKTKYLNLSTESNTSLNGLGIILDMINSCLSIDPKKRPDLSSLAKCDLFQFDQYELILCNKFLDNVLNYYSPEIIIEKNMLSPLRDICSQVMKNEYANPYEINNYENFIFQTIRDINSYLFSRDFIQSASGNSKAGDNEENDIDINEETKDNGKNIFVKNPEYYFKNSMIIKSIIDNKIFDLLIFLVIRHFTTNLSLFKINFQKQLREQLKANATILDSAQSSKLSAMKRANYKNEIKHSCGRLIQAMVDLLMNCVTAMSSYDHMLTLYVENILLYVIKLFIGEDNMLLGEMCDMKNSSDELNKYLLVRTFMRNIQTVTKKNFTEDEADKVFSIMNSNRDLYEIDSKWCPELYDFTIDLFRETFGENCSGNYKHIVIKKYFSTVNDCAANVSNQLENPLVNNQIKDYISVINNGVFNIGYSFINTDYVSEILSLCECSINVKSGNGTENDPSKNLVNKRNALSYIYTLFKGKNEYKIRACLDTKVHFFVQSFLYTNANDYSIKKEVLNIFKEISINLTDINEISWMFGNNYAKIFNETYKSKSDTLDLSEAVTNSNWDSNFCLIDFMNTLLNKPHSFILYFSDRFLGINLHDSNNSVIQLMNEFGLIFSSPLCLKPLMQSLQKSSENIFLRQSCLDILVNLLLSNNPKIISNFNMTMCNFYEVIVSLITSCLTLPPYLKPQSEESNDVLSKARDHFKLNVKQIVKILIELQNPFIKTQMFSCANMVKYMDQNKMSYVPRLEIDEIENEFKKVMNILNFTGLEDKIIFLINAFKNWVLNLDREKVFNSIDKIKNVINALSHVLNNEWSEGLQEKNKNCLVFNIIKLFEWIMKKDYSTFLFPKDNEADTMQMLISLLTKIRETNVNMKNIIMKISQMSASTAKKNEKNVNGAKKKKEVYTKPNAFGNSFYTLQKIYNFISIKMFNIISIIFSKGEDYYNSIFSKIKFGSVFSDLLKTQYETISLFLNEDNIDISIIDNYMVENRLRIHIFENIMNLSKKYDDIKLQFLQSEFLQFMFSSLVFDFRKFKTDYKKLSLEFLAYKNAYPLRTEALSLLNIIIKKYNNPNNKTEIDSFIYDEMIRNMKISHLIQNELAIIKNKIKGNEVLSVMSLFNIVLCNKDKEIIKMMNLENAKEYFIYAIKKDTGLKKLYPHVVDYINKSNAGMDYE